MPKLAFTRRLTAALAVVASRAHAYSVLSVFPNRS